MSTLLPKAPSNLPTSKPFPATARLSAHPVKTLSHDVEVIEGGITAASGFRANGIHAGLKKRKKDLTLVCSDTPAYAAAVFTTNVAKAAPVVWSRQVVQGRHLVKAVIVNSGNANACTGPSGLLHTRQMAEATAQTLTERNFACRPEEVLVASTGVIGVPLPIDKVLSGIPQLAGSLGNDETAALRAAEGILTTDSGVKQIAVRVDIDGTPVTIGAMAKGSGMIHPNMATMLSFIATDADIAPEVLQVALRESVDETYHMISVDGDTSTNDMVVLLANGRAGNPTIASRNQPSYEMFRAALHAVNRTLAEAIAQDGEGASKFLKAQVTGAASKSHARALAKAIVSSTLVKAAFYGADANWGRIVSAMGATGVPFAPEQISLSLSSAAGSILLLERGEPMPFDEAHGLRVLAERNIDIHVALHAGASEATAWGCDLTHDYVTVNSSYRS